MSIGTAIAVYFLIWWLSLFVVLPWGVRPHSDDSNRVPGTDAGAPAVAGIGRKLIWTTAVATAIFALLWAIHTYQLVTLDGLGRVLNMPR